MSDIIELTVDGIEIEANAGAEYLYVVGLDIYTIRLPRGRQELRWLQQLLSIIVDQPERFGVIRNDGSNP